MIIAARRLTEYFPSMTFPVEVLAEKDDRVMFTMNQAQLLKLISTEGVIGIGNWKRIKRLRLNTPMTTAAQALRNDPSFDPDGPGGGCFVPGSSGIGAYKEAVLSAVGIGTDAYGCPVPQYAVIGHVYQFSLCAPGKMADHAKAGYTA